MNFYKSKYIDGREILCADEIVLWENGNRSATRKYYVFVENGDYKDAEKRLQNNIEGELDTTNLQTREPKEYQEKYKENINLVYKRVVPK